MEIPQEGRYICKLAAQAVIYEAGTGSLCAALPCVMVESGFSFKHTLTIVKADGTIQARTVDTCKQVFGWDGTDPFWLMDQSADGQALRDLEFEIVGGPQTSDKGVVYFKSEWLNPLGGGAKVPEAANRQAVLAKYGSKFRALSGALPPARPATVAPKVMPKAPPAAPAGPPPGAAVATMEEAWATLNEANPGVDSAGLEKLWFDAMGRLFPNKSNTDLKPHDWGRMKAELADNVRM